MWFILHYFHSTGGVCKTTTSVYLKQWDLDNWQEGGTGKKIQTTWVSLLLISFLEWSWWGRNEPENYTGKI